MIARVFFYLLSEVASLVGGVEDFVVEYGEVERQAQADGVRGRQLVVGDGGRVAVRVKRVGGGGLSAVAGLELGQVSVVVALHLVVEHLALF